MNHLEVRFYDATGAMAWDAISVQPGECFSLPTGAITADIIPHPLDTSSGDKKPIPRTLSLPEPKGYFMADGREATRIDFIKAKLGTGEWPHQLGEGT